MSSSDPESWLEEHGSALYSFAFLHVRDADRAEDLVQETFLAALKGRRNYQGGSSIRTWLTGILKHKIMDEFRRQSREVSAPESPEKAWEAAEAQRIKDDFADNGRWSRPLVDWGDSEQALSRDQFWAAMEECLSALSPRMARLFVLRELWEMETDEVCKELTVTPTNLWTTLHRARMLMRQCLEKYLNA